MTFCFKKMSHLIVSKLFVEASHKFCWYSEGFWITSESFFCLQFKNVHAGKTVEQRRGSSSKISFFEGKVSHQNF